MVCTSTYLFTNINSYKKNLKFIRNTPAVWLKFIDLIQLKEKIELHNNWFGIAIQKKGKNDDIFANFLESY